MKQIVYHPKTDRISVFIRHFAPSRLGAASKVYKWLLSRSTPIECELVYLRTNRQGLGYWLTFTIEGGSAEERRRVLA